MHADNQTVPGFPMDARVKVAKDQISCDLADEAVILSLDDGIYFGLNDVGARIWHLIQQQSSIAEIQAVLEEEYEVDHERCARDLQVLLQDMLGKGLILIQEETKA